MLQTSLATYVLGAIFLITGIGLFLRGFLQGRATPLAPKDERRYGLLRVSGAAMIGFGILFLFGKWIFVSIR